MMGRDDLATTLSCITAHVVTDVIGNSINFLGQSCTKYDTIIQSLLHHGYNEQQNKNENIQLSNRITLHIKVFNGDGCA